MTKSELLARIDNALLHTAATLNYDKIHAFMLLTKWYWRDANEAPTVAQLKAEVSSLCLHTYESLAKSIPSGSVIRKGESIPLARTSCGGFTVEILPWREVSISFEVTSKDCTVDSYEVGE